jgi:pyrroloquinoline quinone biosynthesis protein D
VIALDAKPKLAAKARLRHDKISGDTLLIYPEAGLKLNATGAEVVRRCTGEATLAAIVEELRRVYAPADASVIEREVVDLVNRLADRGLLVVES